MDNEETKENRTKLSELKLKQILLPKKPIDNRWNAVYDTAKVLGLSRFLSYTAETCRTERTYRYLGQHCRGSPRSARIEQVGLSRDSAQSLGVLYPRHLDNQRSGTMSHPSSIYSVGVSLPRAVLELKTLERFYSEEFDEGYKNHGFVQTSMILAVRHFVFLISDNR